MGNAAKTELMVNSLQKPQKVALIKRLVLYGFKSFANKTTIPFYPGFNAIIGPNGAGKSNIIDAFVFVLGSASREMRAGRLEHVIYNGGYGRKAAEFAEVELHLDNSAKILPYDDDTVIISRRVNRKGQSIYRINGKLETKEKVVEILEIAGIKAGHHNIILQGDVVNLIKMKPKERRAIIDRVAGIEEYNKKKEKAYEELEQAENNLKEARLILDQKKEFLDKLKYERDIALKVKELEEKKKMLEAQLSYSRLKSVEGELERIKNTLDIKEKEYVNAKSKIEGYDLDIESLENELKSLDETIIGLSTENKSSKEIQKVLEKIYEREAKIRENEKEIKYLKDMISKIEAMQKSADSLGKEEEILRILRKEGAKIEGFLKDLISVDEKYRTALEVALGSHVYDVVVEKEEDALKAINILKTRGLGRLRFLPLDRLEKHTPSSRAEISKTMPGVIGYASELISFDPKYKKAVDYALRDTLVAESVNEAKRLRGVRVVTLEGEVFDPSGGIIGGSLKSRKNLLSSNSMQKEIEKYEKKISLLVRENEMLKEELYDLKDLLEELKAKEEGESSEILELQSKKKEIEEKLDAIKAERKKYYEKMLILESEINNLKIKKARLEADYDNIKEDFEQYKEKAEGLKVDDPLKIDRMIRKIAAALREIGIVNMKAIEDYETFKKEYEAYAEKVKKLEEEKKSIEKMIANIEERRKAIFFEAFNKINESFGRIFERIAEGKAMIALEKEGDIDSGLLIKAQPRGKKLLHLDALSGGEKTLVSLAFLFAIQHYRKSSFYLLDEVDAALDKKNAELIGDLIKEYSKDSQFIVISHNDITVVKADRVYGVTMQKGISSVFAVDLHEERKAKQNAKA